MMPQRPTLIRAACMVLAVACAACTSSTAGTPVRAGTATNRPTITVGSFDFPESVLLAYLYADALAGKGYPVRVLPNLGTRELVDPALVAGLIQLVPEYTGSALEFVSVGRVRPTSSVATAAAGLADSAVRLGLVTGRPAAAQDGNAIVVTEATAARYHLHTISDLAPVAARLVFGGPPECPERAYCLPGLRLTYGLRFRSFVPLDAGGPLTRQALMAGEINVALLFTTDPNIEAEHLVILTDNRGLQPAENIVPMLRLATATRYPGALTIINAVSARLSTATMAALDGAVQLAGRSPAAVAAAWLRAQGIVAARQAGR